MAALNPRISDSMTPVLMDAYTAMPILRPSQHAAIIPGIIIIVTYAANELVARQLLHKVL